MVRIIKSVTAIIVLMIISIVLKRYVPIDDIEYIAFCPVLLYLDLMFRDKSLRYKNIFVVTIAAASFFCIGNFFDMSVCLPKIIWCMIGSFITFITFAIYRYISGDKCC